MAATAGRGDRKQGTESGFRAQLSGAALADLVQLECSARSTRAVRVTSNQGIGYLYFRDGEIVHAVTGDESGEAAALEILDWHEGSFEPCQLRVPDENTIFASHQGLLLRAAQRHDETRNRLVGLPKPRTLPRPQLHEVTAAHMPSTKPPPPPSTAPPVDSVSRHLVRLDRNGNVISAQGQSESLAAIAAYAARIGDLIGDAMGLGALLGVEAELSSEHVFVHAEKSGNLVGLRTSQESDVTQVRARFGL
jgi:hypothetical protein